MLLWIMSGMAEEIHMREVLKRPGTVEVGTYKIMWENTSIGGRIPKEHAKPLGVIDAGELDTFVNYELGAVLMLLPREGKE